MKPGQHIYNPHLTIWHNCELVNKCKTRKLQNKELMKIIKVFNSIYLFVSSGGLKVWECAVDLAHYLDTCGMDFHSKTVLEVP